MQSKLEEITNLIEELPEERKSRFEALLKNHQPQNQELFYDDVFNLINFELIYRELAKKEPNEITSEEIDNLLIWLGEQDRNSFKKLIEDFSIAELFSKDTVIRQLWNLALDRLILTIKHPSVNTVNWEQYFTIGLSKQKTNAKWDADMKQPRVVGAGTETLDIYKNTVHETPNLDKVLVSVLDPETTQGETFLWSFFKLFVFTILGTLMGVAACVIFPQLAGWLLVGYFAGAGFGLSTLYTGFVNSQSDANMTKSSYFLAAGFSTIGAIIGSILGTFVFPGFGTAAGSAIGAVVGTAVAVISSLIMNSCVPYFKAYFNSKTDEEPGCPENVSKPECALVPVPSRTPANNVISEPRAGSPLPFFAQNLLDKKPGPVNPTSKNGFY